MSQYKAAIYDAVTLKPVERAKVDLHLTSSNVNALNSQTAELPHMQSKADPEGFFNFVDVFPGTYALKSSKSGYIPFVDPYAQLYSDGLDGARPRNVFLSEASGDWEARFVLSWPGSGVKRDLDLFVDFNVNDKFLCSVGFYLPQC